LTHNASILPALIAQDRSTPFMLIAIIILTVFMASVSVTFAWRWFARRQAWLDMPNLRSSHAIPTPRGGGVGFVVAVAGFLVWLVINHMLTSELVYAFGGAFIVAMIGLIDDRKSLGIRLRLFLQVLAVSCLWPLLQKLPPLVFYGEVAVQGTLLSLLLSIAVLWLINLFNFMDGIDSLAATQAIFCLLAISLLAGGLMTILSLVPLAVAAAVAGFLLFNLPQASLFMGDVGSYFLGYVLAILGLFLVQQEALSYWAFVILLASFGADSSTTLLGRLREGAVWYHPHRSHAYQALARRWASHGKVVLLNAGINGLWLLPLAGLAMYFPSLGLMFALIAWVPLVILVMKVRSRCE
jgi:Fuc2NAc and GlcNAc transferase